MADTLGNIAVPEVAASGTFPLRTDHGHAIVRPREYVTHLFAAGNRKREQNFLLGTGARRFTIIRPTLSAAELTAIVAFWEARKGGYQPFTYSAPNPDQTFTNVTVRFENAPIGWDVTGPSTANFQCTLVEVPADADAPTYTVSATVQRFPSGPLATALLEQDQVVIPLIKIVPKEPGYPAIYVSDRRCTVGGQLYQARVTSWDGISQSMGSASDSASFTFGNADNVLSLLAADTDLFRASVEFSLFVVAGSAGTKVDLWKGEFVDWSDSEGPEFRVQASDGIYELRLPYPTRKVSRSCWKDFNDGLNCPFATEGALDLVNFPSADAGSCDKGYATPNGCAAHGMRRYFGGVIAEPQAVNIKDNSTGGAWGWNRNKLQSTSIVNDTIYDQIIPEVYTDADFPVPAKIAAGRDESEFYQALGIVCEGPVTFGNGHQLDKQFHHGYPGPLGLRTIPGTDPAGATDFLSLDQSGNQVAGDPEKIFSGNSTYKNIFSAGTAALTIRRGDEKGLQLSRPTEHEMTAVIAGGLQGWVWSGAGSRSLETLTNPVWIVVNMMLRARGLRHADAATAEEYFDVAAAVAMAAICDTTVNKIAGLSGTETQFKFRGMLQEEKPLKDWIDEVLMNCLGYYTFAFGKLKLGIRINSSTVEAFTSGNVLADSIQTYPLRAEFNDLTAIYADELFEYAGNSVNAYDIDHQKLVGGEASPLKIKKQVNLSGTTGASQAYRLVQTRLKEELGGATLAERALARRVSFRTTILALNVEPGMVCSLTHDKMPSGAGEFRVLGWRLNPDYSIDIEGQTTTDSMYDATVGPKPADILPSPIPPEQISYGRRPAWMPGELAAGSGDPLLSTDDYSFAIREEEGEVFIRGVAPRNRFLPVPATVIRGISAAATGGSLVAGKNYFVQVAPYKSDQFGPPSNVLAVSTAAGADTAEITIADVEWPVAPSGSWDGYRVMLGHTEHSMSLLAAVAGALPASIDIAGPLRTFSGSIAPHLEVVRAKAKLCYAPGVVRAAVTGVTGTTLVCDAFSGGGDDFAGRKVAIISDDSDGEPGLWHFSCSAYDEATGTFTVTPNPSTAGVANGDQLVVLATATSAAAGSVTDAKWNYATDEVKGKLVRVLYGKGRGQVRTITANTATTLTVEPAWTTQPDTSSVLIIEEPEWQFTAETGRIESLSGVSIEIAMPIGYVDVPLLVAGIGVDKWQMEALEEHSPMRLLFFKGTIDGIEVPGDVQPIGADAFLIEQEDYGINEIQVTITYNPPATIPDGFGVDINVEAPDGSGIVVPKGIWAYNGDGSSDEPERYGTVVLIMGKPLDTEDWRFMLSPAIPTYRKPYVLTGPEATPSMVITVEAGTPTEIAEPGDVQPIGADDFQISVALADPDINGLVTEQIFSLIYNPPTPIAPFVGPSVYIGVPDGRLIPAGDFIYNGDGSGTAPGRYGNIELRVPLAESAGESWEFFLASRSETFSKTVDGTTPSRTITALSLADGPEGKERALNVTGLSVTPVYEFSRDLGWRYQLVAAWTNPVDIRRGGSKIVIRPVPAPTPAESEDRFPTYTGPEDEGWTSELWPLAEDTELDVFVPSIDVLQRENTINVSNSTPPAELTPVVRVPVNLADAYAAYGLSSSIAGREFSSHVTLGSVTVVPGYSTAGNFQTWSLNIPWTNPVSDPRFEGVQFVLQVAGQEDVIYEVRYEKTQTIPSGTQTLEWGLGEDWIRPLSNTGITLWARSIDWQDNVNTIVDGVTPKATGTVTAATAVGQVTDFAVSLDYAADGTAYADVTFTPPADPNFWYIEVWARLGPTGGPYVWQDQLGEADHSGMRFQIFGPFPTSGTQIWPFYAVSVGRDLRKNPASFNIASPSGAVTTTASIGPQPNVVPPANPNSIVGTQPGPQYRQEGTSDLLQTLIRATINMPSGHTAHTVSLEISFDGSNWEEAVSHAIGTGTSSDVDFWWRCPPATDTTVYLRGITHGEGGMNDPNSPVTSGAFTVAVPSPLVSNLITASCSALAYKQQNDGIWYYGFTVTWTNPTGQPFFRLAKLEVRDTDSLGNPLSGIYGQWRPVDEKDGQGAAFSFTAEGWIIPPASSGHKSQLRVRAVDLLNNEVDQTTAWSGQPVHNLLPLEQNGSTGVETGPRATAFTASVSYPAYTAGGAQLWKVGGGITPPADPSHQGSYIYCAPMGIYNISGTTFTRQSGVALTASMVGQKFDWNATLLQIVSVNVGAQSFVASGSGFGSGQTVVFIGEANLIATTGATETVWNSGLFEVIHDTQNFRIFPLSYDYKNDENTWVNGLPGNNLFVDITVARQLGGTGATNAALVTSPSGSVATFPTGVGTTEYIVLGSFTEPSAADYGGVKGIRIQTDQFFSDPGSGSNNWVEMFDIPLTNPGGSVSYRSNVFSAGTSPAYYFVAFISYDKDGRRNPYVHGTTPRVQFTAPVQAKTLDLGFVALGASNIEPVGKFTGGVGGPPFAVPYVGSSAVNISDNKLYRWNGSNAYVRTINGVDIKAELFVDRLTANEISANAINSNHLNAIEISVGSGSSMPGRFAVYSGFSPVGYIGTIPIGSGAGWQGAWFTNLRIGADINNPNFVVNAGLTSGINNIPFTLTSSAADMAVKINETFDGVQWHGIGVYRLFNGTNMVRISPGQIRLCDDVSSSFRVNLYSRTGEPGKFEMYNPSGLLSFYVNTQQSGSPVTIRVGNHLGSWSLGQYVRVFFDKGGGFSNAFLDFCGGVMVNFGFSGPPGPAGGPTFTF
jgi:DNA polymerase III psi subunit